LKFVTFEVNTAIGAVQRIGVLRETGIVDLHAAYAAYLREARGVYGWRALAQAVVPPDMLKFIEGGPVSMDAAHLALDYIEKRGSAQVTDHGEKLLHELRDAKLLAPVPHPVSIRDCSAFLQHVKNAGSRSGAFTELPRSIMRFPLITGPAPQMSLDQTSRSSGRVIPKSWTTSWKSLFALANKV